jgi:hypothetical protein
MESLTVDTNKLDLRDMKRLDYQVSYESMKDEPVIIPVPVTPTPTQNIIITPKPTFIATPKPVKPNERISELKPGDAYKVRLCNNGITPIYLSTDYDFYYGSDYYYPGDTCVFGGNLINVWDKSIVKPKVQMTFFKNNVDIYTDVKTLDDMNIKPMEKYTKYFEQKMPNVNAGFYVIRVEFYQDGIKLLTIVKEVNIL